MRRYSKQVVLFIVPFDVFVSLRHSNCIFVLVAFLFVSLFFLGGGENLSNRAKQLRQVNSSNAILQFWLVAFSHVKNFENFICHLLFLVCSCSPKFPTYSSPKDRTLNLSFLCFPSKADLNCEELLLGMHLLKITTLMIAMLSTSNKCKCDLFTH